MRAAFDAGSGGRGVVCENAGIVGWCAGCRGDQEDFTGVDLVWIDEAVGTGDVTDSEGELRCDRGDGVVGLDGVIACCDAGGSSVADCDVSENFEVGNREDWRLALARTDCSEGIR